MRLFPQEVVRTVVALSELDALSESLDAALGLALLSEHVDAATYVVRGIPRRGGSASGRSG